MPSFKSILQIVFIQTVLFYLRVRVKALFFWLLCKLRSFWYPSIFSVDLKSVFVCALVSVCGSNVCCSRNNKSSYQAATASSFHVRNSVVTVPRGHPPAMWANTKTRSPWPSFHNLFKKTYKSVNLRFSRKSKIIRLRDEHLVGRVCRGYRERGCDKNKLTAAKMWGSTVNGKWRSILVLSFKSIYYVTQPNSCYAQSNGAIISSLYVWEKLICSKFASLSLWSWHVTAEAMAANSNRHKILLCCLAIPVASSTP